MIDKENPKNISKSRIIFFVLSVIVPFVIYSGYYYYKMISKAPFKFVEFEYFEVYSKNIETGSEYLFNSKTKQLDFFKNGEILASYKLNFSYEELHKFHRYLIDNIFFDIPEKIGSISTNSCIYRLKVCYKRKCKEVKVYTNHNSPYDSKIKNIKRYIESNM